MQIIAIKAQADTLLEPTRAAPADGAENAGVFAALLATLTTESPPPTEAVAAPPHTAEVEDASEEPLPEIEAWLPDGIAAVATAAPQLAAPPPMVVLPAASEAEAQSAATVAVTEQAETVAAVAKAQPTEPSEATLTAVPVDVKPTAPPTAPIPTLGQAPPEVAAPQVKVEAAQTPVDKQQALKPEPEVAAAKSPALVLESQAAPTSQPKAPTEHAPAKAEAPIEVKAPLTANTPESVEAPARAEAIAKAEAPAKQPVESPPAAQQAKPQTAIAETAEAQPATLAKEVAVVQPAPASPKAHQREAVAKQTVERLSATRQLSMAYALEEPSGTQADPLLAKLAEANVTATRDTSHSAPLTLHRESDAPAVAPSEDGMPSPVAETGARPPVLGAVLKDTAAGGAVQPSQGAPIEVPVGELARFAERGIKQLLDSGEQRMHIRLTPESLGEMQIEVTRSGGDVQVRLTAATQAVRDLLDANTHHLREALVREGFDTAKIQVAPPSSSGGLNLNFSGAGHDTQQGQQAQQQQQGQAHGNTPRFAGADGSRAPAPQKPQPAHAGNGLNVMV